MKISNKIILNNEINKLGNIIKFTSNFSLLVKHSRKFVSKKYSNDQSSYDLLDEILQLKHTKPSSNLNKNIDTSLDESSMKFLEERFIKNSSRENNKINASHERMQSPSNTFKNYNYPNKTFPVQNFNEDWNSDNINANGVDSNGKNINQSSVKISNDERGELNKIKPLKIYFYRDDVYMNLSLKNSISLPRVLDQKINEFEGVFLRIRKIDDVELEDKMKDCMIALNYIDICKILMMNPSLVFDPKNPLRITIDNQSISLHISQNKDNTFLLKISSNDKTISKNNQNGDNDSETHNEPNYLYDEVSITLKPEEIYLMKKFLDVCLDKMIRH